MPRLQPRGNGLRGIRIGQLHADAVDHEGAAQQCLCLAQQHVAAAAAKRLSFLQQADDAQRSGAAPRRGGGDHIAHAKPQPLRLFFADDDAALHALKVYQSPAAQLVGDSTDLCLHGRIDADDPKRLVAATQPQGNRARERR